MGFLSNDIVTMEGRPVFSMRSTARRASPSHENVSAMTKSGASRSWAFNCSSNRLRTLSLDAPSFGSYIQVGLRVAATPARYQPQKVSAAAQHDALREPFEDPRTARRGTMGFLAGHRRPERGARLIVSRKRIAGHQTYVGPRALQRCGRRAIIGGQTRRLQSDRATDIFPPIALCETEWTRQN